MRNGDSIERRAAELVKDFAEDDCLGKAAAARDRARAAESAGRYDEAWAYYQEQKKQYMEHAQKNRFTAAQTLTLDASVSEQLANVLRVEGKHHDAMVHVLYWISAAQTPTKKQEKKLTAYFRRCKFGAVSEAELQDTVQGLRNNPEYSRMKSVVDAWRKRG